mgnify:CR=1 FL=1
MMIRQRLQPFAQQVRLALLPPAQVVPARDLLEEAKARKRGRRGIVIGLLAYGPLIGVLAITTNLMFQARGNQQLALAVIQNLSFSSLAFVVLANLLVYLIPGLTAGLFQIATDARFPRRLRVASTIAGTFAFGVGLVVTPWYISALVLLLTFVSWRFGHHIRRAVLTRVDGHEQTWFGPPLPEDSKLRRLWNEGRASLSASGVPLDPVHGESPFDNPPRAFAVVVDAVNRRKSKIMRASRRPLGEAAVFALAISVAGNLLIPFLIQVQLAPLERVTLDVVGDRVGYVFSQSRDEGVFVAVGAAEVIHLEQHPITARELCLPRVDMRSVVSLLAPLRSTAVECPRSSP